MRFYIHFNGVPDFTLKATLDDNSKTISDVIQNFVNTYNNKHGSKKTLHPALLQLKKEGQQPFKPEANVAHLINDGDDLYVIEIEKKLVCGRGGCRKEYYEKDNVENVCQYHPGPPIFHEGYKGWKCCDRKVIDFDEFMAIEGCTFGLHEPKVEPPKPETKAPATNVEVISTVGEKEIYKNKDNAPLPSVPKPKNSEPVPVPYVPPKEEPDPPDAVIPIGANCIHQGCKAVYKDDSSRKEECVYHPGHPLFHEGSKGWDCCKKMTLFFDEFLLIEGCTTGLHKFIPEKKAVAVSVRHDFYLSGDFIFVNFYAKNCDKANSTVSFLPGGFTVNLKLADGQIYNKVINFTGGKVIDPSKSSFAVLSTKLEIKLKKDVSGGDWTKL